MKKLLIGIFLVLFSCVAVMSQNIDFKKVDVSKLSDAQIRQISTEMSARGYKEDDIRVLAKAKGASQKQIDELIKRLQSLKKTSQNKTNQNQKNNLDDSELTSERALFEPTSLDSLVFGFSLFNNTNLSFEPNVNIPVPEGYVLGVGDELVVSVWGQSNMSYNLTVSNNGYIEIPIAGPVSVMGLSIKEASRKIEQKLSSIYSDLGDGTTVSIKTGKIRTINVHVMGEVQAPGTYIVSGAASLFNVLYLSGGPNVNGSFRNIQLLRGGKVVATLDVYDYLLNYKSEVNVPLYNNDIVMVPTYQKRIAIGGEFIRTGYFESKEGETVEDMVRYAGGFKPNAIKNHIGLMRVGKVGKEYKDVIDPGAIATMNGDSLFVSAINEERIDNAVEIKGGVFAPGYYEYNEGLKLSDLLKRSGGLVENAFLSRGVITRMKDDYTLQSLNFNVHDLANGTYDVQLKDKDVITISTIDDQREKPIVTIKGAVNQPDEFDYAEGITVGDLILLAGGLTSDASVTNVEIVRKLSEAVADTSEYSVAEDHSISITRDLSLDDSGSGFVLNPFDIVTIRRQPSAQFKGTVTVSGEVRMPGTYEMVNKNDNIITLIERAGGLTQSAYIDGAKLYRKVVMSEKERNIKIAQAKAQSEDTTKISMLMNDDTYELVSIDLKDIVKNKQSLSNMRLNDGDEIVIPCKVQTVKIGGEVLNPLAVTWTKRMSAKKYVNMAGGFSSKAKKSKTYVVYPDGHAEATGRFLWFKRYPRVEAGCEVMVPTKPEREGVSPTQIVSMSSSVLTMVVVIMNIIDKR